MKKALLIVAPLTDYEDSQENSGPDFEKNRLVSPIDAITTATILRDRDIKVELFDLGIYGGFREKRDQFSKFAANNKFDFCPCSSNFNSQRLLIFMDLIS